ncbi:MAG: VWA domain-containing protein [Acidobacteriota bacterium]|nr:MAG: VWA domain-containing protein [Acidobacteriota bacterium]
MKRSITLTGLVFLLGCSFSGNLKAQEDSPVFRTNVNVVNVLCTVRKGDQYLTNLTKEDFEVFEDGQKQEIEYFGLEFGEDAQPLNVILLVDTSGSVKDKLFFEQEAGYIFLKETLRRKKDLAAVVQFDSEINLVQDFTYDLELLEHSIEDIRAGGATKLYDAIYLSVDELLRHEFGRKLLVVLSDGDDTQSLVKDDEAIQIAQEHDVMIFGIGVKGGRFRSNFGKLKEFAEETGGLFFNSKASMQELQEAFSKINRAIKNQYSIGYTSSNPVKEGEFREIRIEVKGRGLKVAHRKGYYSSETG